LNIPHNIDSNNKPIDKLFFSSIKSFIQAYELGSWTLEDRKAGIERVCRFSPKNSILELIYTKNGVIERYFQYLRKLTKEERILVFIIETQCVGEFEFRQISVWFF
jgi:hypothetical protein